MKSVNNVWWTVNGADMAWNNKNLQRMFPTVPVYRNVPGRELVSRPNPAIAEFTVDTMSDLDAATRAVINGTDFVPGYYQV